MAVTSVTGVSANGMTVSVANPTSTPQITVGTSVSGVLKGVSGAVAAAVAGTDYLAPGHARPMLTPEQFGAAGNGTTDDLTPLNNCFAAAAGADVYLNPAKTYLHSNVVTVGQNGTRIVGGGTLLANTEAQSAVLVSGNYCSIQGVTLAFSQSGATKQFNPQANKLWVSGSHFIATDVYINGAACMGVYMAGAANFTLTGLYVYNTFADGIHTTGASTNGRIIACTCDTTGDDAFPVISYDADSGPCSNIVNIGCRSINSSSRGFVVGGGQYIKYIGGSVYQSTHAGIYIACEPSFNLRTSTDIVIDGMELIGVDTNGASDGHGAIYVYNGRTSSQVMDRITIRNVTIRDTSTAAPQQVHIATDAAGADNIRDLVFQDIKIQGTGPSNKFYNYQVPQNRYKLCSSLIDRRVYTTSAYKAIDGLDQVILIGPGGSVALPDATRCVNRYTVSNVDSAAHNITAASDSGATQNIDGSSSAYSLTAGATITFLPDASGQWFSF
ncbi:hypothetical protein [Mycolicibacterium llatzerense]|uniref:hypothetical protein n=1 Tax=Mycolicibacterium llatzerense TaxID=280871 RepID=UPI000B0C2072|nr:hypothetical protein [Mycolicibacterium llatzerense]